MLAESNALTSSSQAATKSKTNALTTENTKEHGGRFGREAYLETAENS
jgi:hypothetical protein